MIELRLPFPVSVNAAYINNKGKGRGRLPSPELRAWRAESGWMLIAQHPPKFSERVSIEIDLDESRQGDCDGRIKCVLDLLVEHGVIQDDRKKFVKRVSIGWECVDGCKVRIIEMGEDDAEKESRAETAEDCSQDAR